MGKPPRNILDQVEHAENVIESDLELNYAFVSKTGRYKNERTETHTQYFSKTNQHMSDSTDPTLLVHYYEYASQLVDAALISGPNPGPPPQAYTAWASANGKPRTTFTDPNGDVQWVGQHPIPAAGPPTPGPYAYPYAPYQPYAAPSLSSAHTGLMTPLEHLSYLGKIRDYEQEVAWEAGHCTYHSGGRNKVWLNDGKKPAPYDKSAAKSKGKPKDDIPAPKRLSQAEIDTMVKSAMATLETVKEHIAKKQGRPRQTH
ncbi:hypothetical protein JB92DRAFT_3133393 [Gautieria morchelliformis]|nr:hypothetical protein JB92DRAFT_3133393 [Gautieria morchelliformis]